jgi:hypothetical protein
MKFKLSKRTSDDATEDASAPPADSKKREKKIKPPKEPKAPKPPKEPKSKKIKEKKTGKSTGKKSLKSFSLSKKNLFILSIGDEGAILTHLKNKKVEGRWFANTPSDENFEMFSKAIAMQSNTSILVVLDTMDQIYSQQTLPPVSKMSLNGLLKRRSKREFEDIELQGNYLLERTATKEWSFIIFAIEQREDVLAWLDWVAKLHACPLGIRALPLEMTQLANVLYETRPKNADNDNTDKEWRFLISHNKVSGFRQVIVRNEKMILTRLSQPLDGGADVQAGVIEQEISSTLEYLKRIGLKSYQDVHLNVIASDDMVKLIDAKKIGVSSYEFLSPYQVSQKFAWDDITQPEDRFGDVFLGAFSLANKKSIAKLWTKPLQKLNQLYKVTPALRVIGAFIVIVCIGSSIMSALEWWESSDNIDMTRRQNSQSALQLEEVKKTVNLPPEDLDKALAMLDFYKRIKQDELTPKPFLIDLASAFANMPEDMRVQNIEWNESPTPANAAPPPPVPQDPNAPKPPVGREVATMGMLAITISVPKNIKSEALQSRSKSVIDKLQTYMKYYQITLAGASGAIGANDTLNINLTVKPEEVDEGFRTEIINATFTGKEYLPEPTFEPQQ